MNTKISSNNPFGKSRYGFAFEHIDNNTKCLDYGCGYGKFIKGTVANKNNIQFIGVDKSEVRTENINDIEIHLIKDDNRLPFNDNTFDIVTMLDVLEHIYKQETVLKEINRILKPGGKFIITVPGKSLMSILDTGNIKFRFWDIYLFYRKIIEKNPVNIKDGMINDIEIKKMWHQHFSFFELRDLLNSAGFKINIRDGDLFFSRLYAFLYVIGLGSIIPRKLRELDHNYHKECLFIICR